MTTVEETEGAGLSMLINWSMLINLRQNWQIDQCWSICHNRKAQLALINLLPTDNKLWQVSVLDIPAACKASTRTTCGTSLKMQLIFFCSSTSKNCQWAVLGTSVLYLAPCSLLALREVLPRHYQLWLSVMLETVKTCAVFAVDTLPCEVVGLQAQYRSRSGRIYAVFCMNLLLLGISSVY